MSHFTTAGSRAKFALLFLGGLAGLAAVGANAAGLNDGVPSIVLKYSRQSLATDSGVNALYRRITDAAKQVCPNASPRDLSAQFRVQECRKQAIDRAIGSIDNSRLAAVYAHLTKQG